ncbi:MAG: LLM class flavin-dependent oxidoreductase [Acidimicrobiales bacterium]|jgi:alkanesulfonate monooxygenase SsuD/methylene tetrahydromethanopterin reductase-like flavin-dependent oxidoreductase (luciferase family)
MIRCRFCDDVPAITELKGTTMHVGMSVIFQNPGEALPDRQVYEQDLSLAMQAEPLGFDSIWSVEHHFTDYTMCPNVFQFLTYMAGATKNIQLGSMVAVLPWHDPIRIAEQIAMLDNLSGGRTILGMGRGTGKVEFDGFRTEMDSARLRFKETAEMVLNSLENGYAEYDGELVKQPRVELRPRPFKSMRGRTYAAAVSPESAEIMAEMGVGILIVPQKPWKAVKQELQDYRDVYRRANDEEPPPPYVAGWTFVDESEDRAETKAREFIGGYWDTIIDHYEFDKPHLKDTPGYEHHGQMYDRLMAPGGMEKMTDFFVGLQIWGTPDQVTEKIVDLQDHTHMEGYMGVFSYAGMPIEEADRNMKLFAKEVMPGLQAMAPAAERLGMPA